MKPGRSRLALVLASFAVVLAITLAIFGSSSERLQRASAQKQPLVSPQVLEGLLGSRFLISADALRAWLAGPNPPLVLDVREKAPYDVGHVTGALLRPARSLLDGSANLKAGQRVLIYDQDGRLSATLIGLLRAHGVDAYQLAGGYVSWLGPNAQLERKLTALNAAQQAGATGAETKAAAASPAPAAPPPAQPTVAPPPAGAPAPAAPAAPAHEGC
jgi:rhodanese-related sulfurtransferase